MENGTGVKPGQPIRLGDGRTYYVPPMPYRLLRPFLDLSQRADDGGGWIAMIDDSLRLVHQALQRNYPDLTFDQLSDLLIGMPMCLELTKAAAIANRLGEAPEAERASP